MTSRLTIKGQVTLPKALRDRYELRPGAPVSFEAQADGIKVVPVRKTILDWAGSLPSTTGRVRADQVRRRVREMVARRIGRELRRG